MLLAVVSTQDTFRKLLVYEMMIDIYEETPVPFTASEFFPHSFEIAAVNENRRFIVHGAGDLISDFPHIGKETVFLG